MSSSLFCLRKMAMSPPDICIVFMLQSNSPKSFEGTLFAHFFRSADAVRPKNSMSLAMLENTSDISPYSLKSPIVLNIVMGGDLELAIAERYDTANGRDFFILFSLDFDMVLGYE